MKTNPYHGVKDLYYYVGMWGNIKAMWCAFQRHDMVFMCNRELVLIRKELLRRTYALAWKPYEKRK